MKILRIIPELDFGGLEQRIRLTMFAFKSIPDVELKVVVLGHEGRVSNKMRKEDYKLLILNQNIKIPNLPLIYRLQRIIKHFQPNVVHCSAAEANFHGLIAAYLSSVPLRIGEEIGFPNHGFLWKHIFKTVYSLSHQVVAISNSVSRRLLELDEVGRKKVQVIYNPVEMPEPNQELHLEKEFDWFVFVTTCRLVPVKNIEMLIEVFAELVNNFPYKRLFLHIVGDGPEKSRLKTISDALGVEAMVQFKGYQAEVLPYLLNSDAFVLPSFSEGFSISLVEAMLCGLPCIVTKNGGPSEVIRDNETGFLVDPTDKKELSNAMTRIVIMDDHGRKAMGKKAKMDAERFSLDSYVGKLLKLYST